MTDGDWIITNMLCLADVTEDGKVTDKFTGEPIAISLYGSGTGYKRAKISMGKMKLCAYVHRMVAIKYIANPDNKPFINHINGIKTDNRVENLEWCTGKENAQHAAKLRKKSINNSQLIRS